MPGTFVPVANVGEFTVVQNYDNQNVVNVFHVLKVGGWTSASLATMAEVFISAYNDNFAANMGNNLKFVIVRCRDLTSQAGAIAEVNFPPLSGGDNQFGGAPGNVAFSVSHTTGQAGRSFRGRTSFAAVPQGNILISEVNDNYRNAMVNACDALDAAINAGGGSWVVVSRYSGYTQSPPKYKKVPTPRVAGIATDIINHSADLNIDSQRSRLVGRGS